MTGTAEHYCLQQTVRGSAALEYPAAAPLAGTVEMRREVDE